MRNKDKLTAESVRERYDYDPKTGHLTHRYRVGIRREGDRAGIQKPYGYRHIYIDRHEYLEHRVIWLHVHGAWPVHTIDHINQNPADNRLENLRDVTTRENNQNKSTLPESKVKNVRRRGSRFLAYTTLKGKQINLGSHATASDARQAYERFVAEKIEVAA